MAPGGLASLDPNQMQQCPEQCDPDRSMGVPEASPRRRATAWPCPAAVASQLGVEPIQHASPECTTDISFGPLVSQSAVTQGLSATGDHDQLRWGAKAEAGIAGDLMMAAATAIGFPASHTQRCR